jgi:uncharacterized protein YfaT (DUF1175 family)
MNKSVCFIFIFKIDTEIIMAEVVKIEKSKENEDVLEKAQPGDMIEFIRGAYSHWGIYVGKLCLLSIVYLCFILYLIRSWFCDPSMG